MFCLWVAVTDKIWSERVNFGPKTSKMAQDSNYQVGILSILFG